LIGETGGMTVTIKYLKAGAYQVSDSTGKVIAGNVFDSTLGYVKNITT